jgi:hypothetical protein
VADFSSLQIIASNLDKLIIGGIPNSVGTYGVHVKACNEAEECVSDSFNIVVKDSLPTNTDLTTTLIIIGSIAGAVCIVSFYCVLIGIGIVVLRRYRNKILKKENSTETKELKEEKKLQKLDIKRDKKVFNSELSQSIEK